MASVTFNFQTDMRVFTNYNAPSWQGAGGTSGTATEYDKDWNAGFYEIVKGTGFSGFVGGGSNPATGTVTDWELGIGEVLLDPLNPFYPIIRKSPIWTFSGLSSPALDFADATTGDGAKLAAYMPTILNGDDTVRGCKDGDFLLGYDGNDTIYGGAGNDGLDGGIGADTLDGGVGLDEMFGGTGNDTFIVDNASDFCVENASEGTDLVKSSVSYVLGANVEKLQLTGSAAINASGNSLNNVLNGNSGNNVLDGNGGADAMGGGLGDDTYVIDNAGDAVVENASAGTDLVKSFISYTLGNNVEKLQLVGSANINGNGNGLNNVLNGNGGDNVLDGKGGGDTVGGGAGNDTIIGGLGNDQLAGGAGTDKFVFDTGLTANFDKISDFSAVDDTVVLDQSIFSGISGLGTLAASAFFAGTSAHDADDRIIYDNATGRIWYDADGNGAGGAILFAQVNAGAGMTSADILVVA